MRLVKTNKKQKQIKGSQEILWTWAKLIGIKNFHGLIFMFVAEFAHLTILLRVNSVPVLTVYNLRHGI